MRVEVAGVPAWVDRARLLDDGAWDGDPLVGERTVAEAADLAARLRGLVLAGTPIEVRVTPPLPRPAVRAARTEEARRMRDGSIGFTRQEARVDALGRTYLTPERLAVAIGRRHGGATVIDACCGCGGNAIGFARAGARVTAIERDAERLALARHNARAYGVSERITFVHGDALERLPSLAADLLFLDPPWGGADAPHDAPLLTALVARAGMVGGILAKVPPGYAGFPDAPREAWFGHAPGDRRRIKFVLLRLSG